MVVLSLNIALVWFAVELGTLPTELLFAIAEWVPQLERFPFVVVCRLIYRQRIPWNGKSDMGCFVHSVALLQWAFGLGVYYYGLGYAVTCARVARGGNLKVLQWVRKNGYPWDEQTCSAAALGGHLEVLQWARDNGCPWNEDTCDAAARGGHLEVLQWAHGNGCPWDERICSHAGINEVVVQWARENGCPWAEGGNLVFLQYILPLLPYGCSSPQV